MIRYALIRQGILERQERFLLTNDTVGAPVGFHNWIFLHGGPQEHDEHSLIDWINTHTLRWGDVEAYPFETVEDALRYFQRWQNTPSGNPRRQKLTCRILQFEAKEMTEENLMI